MYKLAIVNSKTFLSHSPELKEKLQKRVQITRLELPKDISPEELAEKLKGCQIIVASITPHYTERFFQLNKDVVLIARHGTGIDNIDIKAATQNGVIITRVPGKELREAVAEHAIALILTAIRKICKANEAVREGKWKERGKYVGTELREKVVGIIGLGNIGSRVAEILVNGFKSKVIAYDPYINEAYAEKVGVQVVSFDELLEKSDIISIHCPLTPETYHLIDHNAFEKMKNGIIIINTARGSIIDTKALIENIKNGKVAAVALDVIEDEPIDETHEILKFKNVVITPHIASSTIETLRRMDESCFKDIISLLNGKTPPGLVNKEVLTQKNLRFKTNIS